MHVRKLFKLHHYIVRFTFAPRIANFTTCASALKKIGVLLGVYCKTLGFFGNHRFFENPLGFFGNLSFSKVYRKTPGFFKEPKNPSGLFSIHEKPQGVDQVSGFCWENPWVFQRIKKPSKVLQHSIQKLHNHGTLEKSFAAL